MGGKEAVWQANSDAVNVRLDECVLHVELSRPEVHNALNRVMLRELDRLVAWIAREPGIRVVLLTGAGSKSFSAGADIDEFLALDVSELREMMSQIQEMFQRIERSSIPFISQVNGLALGGGCELVLACSFAIGCSDASFGLPEAGLGLLPGYGGTQRLPRKIGRSAALHMMLTGARISAQRAYELGWLVLPPVPREQLAELGKEVASSIVARGPTATKEILRLVVAGSELPFDEGLRLETAAAFAAICSDEGREGIAAFKERRKPEFRQDVE